MNIIDNTGNTVLDSVTYPNVTGEILHISLDVKTLNILVEGTYKFKYTEDEVELEKLIENFAETIVQEQSVELYSALKGILSGEEDWTEQTLILFYAGMLNYANEKFAVDSFEIQ